jgi:hypothetical protein
VYLAEDRSLSNKVAITTLLPSMDGGALPEPAGQVAYTRFASVKSGSRQYSGICEWKDLTAWNGGESQNESWRDSRRTV